MCGRGWGEFDFFTWASAGEIPFLPNIPARIALERFLPPLSMTDTKNQFHYKIRKLSRVNDDASDDCHS